MISVIMSAVMLRLMEAGRAAFRLVCHLPQNRPFELSDDGEHLFSRGMRYDFVGFSEDGRYTAESGETVHAGSRLGYIVGENGCRVRRTTARKGTYVMLRGTSDCSEVYRLSE